METMRTMDAVKTILEPLSDRVVVRPDTEEETERRVGSLYIPASAQADPPNMGTVLAVGPGTLVDGKVEPVTVAVGDRVLFGRFSGTEIELDGEDLVILREPDILCRVREG